MEKLNKEKVEKLNFTQGAGRGRGEFRKILDELAVGEGLSIKKEEWDVKTPPGVWVSGTFRNLGGVKKFSTRTLVDKSGWCVVRTK